MGHYRSEMGFEAEDERKAAEAEKHRKTLAKSLQADIERRGLENVLADILIDPSGYRRRKGY